MKRGKIKIGSHRTNCTLTKCLCVWMWQPKTSKRQGMIRRSMVAGQCVFCFYRHHCRNERIMNISYWIDWNVDESQFLHSTQFQGKWTGINSINQFFYDAVLKTLPSLEWVRNNKSRFPSQLFLRTPGERKQSGDGRWGRHGQPRVGRLLGMYDFWLRVLSWKDLGWGLPGVPRHFNVDSAIQVIYIFGPFKFNFHICFRSVVEWM